MAEILLTPEILIAQSSQMQTLGNEFESLFSQVTTVLHGMNDSWSENIATNFVSKILLAQQSFSSIVNMLENGSAAARVGAMSFANGVDMGQILDSVNSNDTVAWSNIPGNEAYYDYNEGVAKGIAEGTGDIKSNYIHGLGEYLKQDYKDIMDMLKAEDVSSYGDVAKKYAEMLWHYGPEGVLRAEAKTIGIDFDSAVKTVTSDTGELYELITGDKGAADYFKHYYDDGLDKGIVNGLSDILGYLNDEVKKSNIPIGKVFKSMFS